MSDKSLKIREEEVSKYILTCSSWEYLHSGPNINNLKIELKDYHHRSVDILKTGSTKNRDNLEELILSAKEELVRKGKKLNATVITDTKPSINFSYDGESINYSIYFIGNALFYNTGLRRR